MGNKQAIFKYPLADTIEMPAGATLLTVQMQGGEPMLWALVNPEEKRTATRRLAVYGTGWHLTEPVGQYVATYQQGRFVWHVFDLGER